MKRNRTTEKKVIVSIYLTPRQDGLLHELSFRSRIPMSAIIREALDALIAKNQHLLQEKSS